MNFSDLIDLDLEDKKSLWEVFKYERLLEETEEDLIKDLEYYSQKIKAMGEPTSSLDIGIMTVYKAHINGIERLLNITNNLKQTELEQKQQMNVFL